MIKTLRAGAVAALTAAALSAGGLSAAGPASAAPAGDGEGYTFAVIGDIPYTDAQIAGFPAVVAQINADPSVRWVDHLGDIKSGSSLCSDDYFRTVRSDFDRFEDPLVYTPGDNEWTDCHRPAAGSYNPLERLAAIRRDFFPVPGRTLGQDPVPVLSQAGQGLPENVRWRRAGVSFSALHIVGSNNSLVPWTGNTAPTPEQTAEVIGRTAAAIQQLRETFATATRDHDRAVVLLTQADMFDPTVPTLTFADVYGFQAIVRAIARESGAFKGPVYLFNGDSHVYNAGNPLAAGSKWLTLYGVDASVPNLTRVTVDGSTGVDNYLRVTVHERSRDVLTWTKVPFIG